MGPYSPAFKARVVLEALRSTETDLSIAQTHGVHPVTLSRWKTHLLEEAEEVFASNDQLRRIRRRCLEAVERVRQLEQELALLHQMVDGEVSIETKIAYVDQYRDQIGLNRACAVFQLSKSTYYHRAGRRDPVP